MLLNIAYAASEGESGNSIIGYLLWALLLGFVAVIFVQKYFAKRKYKGVKFENDTNWLELSQPMYEDDGIVHQYYFHYDKSFFAQGNLMEDRDHKLIYEAKFLYNNVVGNDEVDFINHILHCKSHHQISHASTKSVGTGNWSLITDSGLNFDNINVWNYLSSMGFSVQMDRKGLSLSFIILKNGEKVGRIFTTNMGKDFFAGKELVPKMGGAGFFIVEGENKFMDILFLYALAISKCESQSSHDTDI